MVENYPNIQNEKVPTWIASPVEDILRSWIDRSDSVPIDLNRGRFSSISIDQINCSHTILIPLHTRRLISTFVELPTVFWCASEMQFHFSYSDRHFIYASVSFMSPNVIYRWKECIAVVNPFSNPEPIRDRRKWVKYAWNATWFVKWSNAYKSWTNIESECNRRSWNGRIADDTCQPTHATFMR